MISLKANISIFGAVVLFSMSALAEISKFTLKAKSSETEPMDPAKQDGKINSDFPEPTDIRDIAKAFSLWTGNEYTVDERVRAKVKLVSPERISKEEALRRFHQMLASYNLKSIADGSGYRIVQAIDSDL